MTHPTRTRSPQGPPRTGDLGAASPGGPGAVMGMLRSVPAGAARVLHVALAESSAALEHTAAEGQHRSWSRWVDPLDVAGRTARAVSPRHATPLVAHAVYFAVLGGLAATEVVDPAVALLLAGGHLMLQSHNQYLEQAAEALADTV